MKDIRCLVGKLVGAYEDTLHTKTKPTTTMASGAAQVESGESAASTSVEFRPENENSVVKFENPFRELFLWAVLMNRFELARCMWEKVEEEAVPNALAACRIFRAMQNKDEGDIFREPTVLQQYDK